MEGSVESPALPLLPALAEVMTVRAGTVCAVDSPGLAMAMAAGASSAGAWVGFAGLPELGWEAAADLGLQLDRTVAVPFPGEHWLSVTAALVDVVSVVVARPPGQVGEAQAGRIAARLRQRGCVLIVEGAWPRAAVRVRTLTNRWSGLGSGHGHLDSRQVSLEISTATGVPRRATLGVRAGELWAVPVSMPTEVAEPIVAMVG